MVDIEQQKQAFDLWFNEKKSLRDIGEIIGVSHEKVRKLINIVLDKIADEFDDEVRTWRAKQLKRLMRQYDRFDRMAGDSKATRADRTRAGTLCLGILKEVSDITNVKAPLRHEVTGKDGEAISTITKVILEFSDEPTANNGSAE